jgi:hypothetical protein
MISTTQFDIVATFASKEAAYLINADLKKHSPKEIEEKWNTLVIPSLEAYKEWDKSFTEWPLQRYEIINHLIKKFNYQNYLEIGVRDGDCFSKINIVHKDAVDPEPVREGKQLTNYPISSDEFFDLIEGHDIKYDIIFIDGLHHDYQVYKDICNAINHLTPDGTIICHDMNPLYFVTSMKRGFDGVGQWNGDCWQAWAKLRTENPNISMEVINTDHGVGIIRNGKQKLFNVRDKSLLNIVDGSATWELLETYRKELLNLKTVKEFYNKYD